MLWFLFLGEKTASPVSDSGTKSFFNSTRGSWVMHVENQPVHHAPDPLTDNDAGTRCDNPAIGNGGRLELELLLLEWEPELSQMQSRTCSGSG